MKSVLKTIYVNLSDASLKQRDALLPLGLQFLEKERKKERKTKVRKEGN